MGGWSSLLGGQKNTNLTGMSSTDLPQQALPFQVGLYSRQDPKNKMQFLGDVYSSEGVKALEQGGNLLQQPINYYQKILSGDRQSMLEAEAPEVSSIVSGYKAARQGASEFTPRGGGRVQSLEQQPFQEAGSVTSLLQKARPEAAAAMTQIGQNLQQVGINEESLGSQNYATVMNYILGKSTAEMGMFGSLGEGIGSLIGGLAIGGLL